MSRRVALVTHTLEGGVWSVTEFLRRALLRSGLFETDTILLATSYNDRASVKLISPKTWFKGPQVIQGSQNGQPYTHIGAVMAEFEFQHYLPRSVLTGILNQYDLIQIVAGTPAWAVVARGLNRPVCLFAATLAKEERASLLQCKAGWKKIWIKQMTRWTNYLDQKGLSSADCVFAESVYTLNLYAPIVNPTQLVLGPPGVDTNYFSPKPSYDPEGYILSVGRFGEPRKNIRLLFEAFYRLRQISLRVPQLILAGSTGPTSEDWGFSESLGISQYIKVFTDVSVNQLRELYQNARFFVLSSSEEGLGLVILEAMACGLPIVSTDCGGPSTAVEQGVTGLLTPVGDVEALAVAMKQLLESPNLCRAMGQRGRQRVENHFSIETAGQAYLDKYIEILKPKVR
jgi:glycosyltransferase involved in cell wall biosynthesis